LPLDENQWKVSKQHGKYASQCVDAAKGSLLTGNRLKNRRDKKKIWRYCEVSDN
jgi:hypothetical protein